jgi:hypothetical protein
VHGNHKRLELHGVEWIRGVRVSGTIDNRGRGTLTVSGPASGTVGVTTTANLCAPIPAAMTLTGNGT